MPVDLQLLTAVKNEILGIDGGVTDGPVNVTRYIQARPRIVWVLREVNFPGASGWDLSQYLDCDLETYSRWQSTYGLVAKVSHALLQQPHATELPQNATDVRDAIRDVAVINVSKVGGGSRAQGRDLRERALRYEKLVALQLDALAPDIVIAGGTFSLVPAFRQQFSKDAMAGPIRAAKWRDSWLVNMYHPGQSRLRHEVVFAQLRDALVSAGYASPQHRPRAARQ